MYHFAYMFKKLKEIKGLDIVFLSVDYKGISENVKSFDSVKKGE